VRVADAEHWAPAAASRIVTAESAGNRVHVAVDDHSRIAYVEELADESLATTAAFLERAVDVYAGHGISIERVLSGNGGCYRSDSSPRAQRGWASGCAISRW
jgi:hypothetical protein